MTFHLFDSINNTQSRHTNNNIFQKSVDTFLRRNRKQTSTISAETAQYPVTGSNATYTRSRGAQPLRRETRANFVAFSVPKVYLRLVTRVKIDVCLAHSVVNQLSLSIYSLKLSTPTTTKPCHTRWQNQQISRKLSF